MSKLTIEYKIGLIFYTILILSVLAILGCKHIEKKNEQKQIEQEVEQMLDFPNIAKITIQI